MSKVLLESEGAVVKLTLNDPHTLNAIGPAMAEEIRAAVMQVADPANGYRCLVLTGAGRGFCSGGSLAWMDDNRQARAADQVVDHGISLGTHHHFVLKQLKDLPFPVITAVNGPAAGLGFSYALAGDLIVAARSAFFVASFAGIGVTPDGGLSWMLPRMIGWARAKELLLLATRLSADRALEWGMINRVFDDPVFMEQTLALAHEVANGPTVALGLGRRLAWESWAHGYEQHLDQEERLQALAFDTQDAVEGGKSMLEKRKPHFIGR